MRIVHQASGRTAEKRGYQSGAPATYRAFPPSKNEVLEERSFGTIEELALFILQHPDWKVWVRSNGVVADGQVNSGLVIEGSFDIDQLKRNSLIGA